MKKERFDLRHVGMEAFILTPFFVVVKDDSKKSGVNVITVSYVSVASEHPPIIGLAIRPGRHSFSLLEKHWEFTLNLPTVAMLADLDFCGSHSGKKFDKVAERKLELEPAQKITTPIIAACPINLECEVRDISHLKASHEFVLADVAAFHRAVGFKIEDHQGVVTTNYDYRSVGKTLGRAFKVWNSDVKRR